MSAEPAPTPWRVLIVDDSFLMRGIVRGIVEQDPALTVVGEAADGIEALAQVARLAPHLVLLDIEMPRMDGPGFLRRVRLASDAKVIVISSIAQLGSTTLETALDLGADDILPKPSGVLSLDLGERRARDLLEAIRLSLAA